MTEIMLLLLSGNITKHKNMPPFFLFLWSAITKITRVQFICSTYHQVIFKINYLLHNLKIKLRHPVIRTHIETTVNEENQICQITQERENGKQTQCLQYF